jgi:hypothetical protein
VSCIRPSTVEVESTPRLADSQLVDSVRRETVADLESLAKRQPPRRDNTMPHNPSPNGRKVTRLHAPRNPYTDRKRMDRQCSSLHRFARVDHTSWLSNMNSARARCTFLVVSSFLASNTRTGTSNPFKQHGEVTMESSRVNGLR